MKLTKTTPLKAAALLLCGFGVSLAGSNTLRVFLGLSVIIAVIGAYRLAARERQARVLIPAKIRREEPVIVRRRCGR